MPSTTRRGALSAVAGVLGTLGGCSALSDDPLPIETVWRTGFDDASSVGVTADGTLLAGSHSSFADRPAVSRLDEATSETQWSVTLSKGRRSPITVRGTRAYLSSMAGLVGAVDTTAGEGVNFEEGTFREPVYLSDATFDGTCRWIETEFRTGVWCNRATFGKLNAHRVTADDSVDLSEAEIDEIQLRQGRVHDRALFNQTTFDTASFAETQFHETVQFDGTRLSKRLSLRNVTVDDELVVRDVRTPSDGTVVRLDGAHVEDGRLCPAVADSDGTDTGPLVYDLVGATVGDVSLGSGATLDHYRFSTPSSMGSTSQPTVIDSRPSTDSYRLSSGRRVVRPTSEGRRRLQGGSKPRS